MILKEFSKSFKALLKPEQTLKLDPKVDFVNGLDKYRVKIYVDEGLKDKIKTEVKPASLSISVNDFKKKIYFSQPVEVDNVKSWYENGGYFMELPKSPESPVDRLNRMALMLGV